MAREGPRACALSVCARSSECGCELTPAFLNTGSVIFTIPVTVPMAKDSLLASAWGSHVVLDSEAAFSQSARRASEQQLGVGAGSPRSRAPCTRPGIPRETRVGKWACRGLPRALPAGRSPPPSPFGPLSRAQALWGLFSINITFRSCHVP